MAKDFIGIIIRVDLYLSFADFFVTLTQPLFGNIFFIIIFL